MAVLFHFLSKFDLMTREVPAVCPPCLCLLEDHLIQHAGVYSLAALVPLRRIRLLLEVQFPYELSCTSVCWSVGLSQFSKKAFNFLISWSRALIFCMQLSYYTMNPTKFLQSSYSTSISQCCYLFRLIVDFRSDIQGVQENCAIILRPLLRQHWATIDRSKMTSQKKWG